MCEGVGREGGGWGQGGGWAYKRGGGVLLGGGGVDGTRGRELSGKAGVVGSWCVEMFCEVCDEWNCQWRLGRTGVAVTIRTGHKLIMWSVREVCVVPF